MADALILILHIIYTVVSGTIGTIVVVMSDVAKLFNILAGTATVSPVLFILGVTGFGIALFFLIKFFWSSSKVIFFGGLMLLIVLLFAAFLTITA